MNMFLHSGCATLPRHLPGIGARPRSHTPARGVIRIIRIIRSYGHTAAWRHLPRLPDMEASWRHLPGIEASMGRDVAEGTRLPEGSSR